MARDKNFHQIKQDENMNSKNNFGKYDMGLTYNKSMLIELRDTYNTIKER